MSMAKAVKKKSSKKRASTYEKPVKFEGTFEDMIAILRRTNRKNGL